MKFEVNDPTVLAGVIFGAMLPLLFSALTMISVGKAAAAMIDEVRRQFRDVEGVDTCTNTPITLGDVIKMAGEREDGSLPDYIHIVPETEKCVAISTKSSLYEMIAPGSYAVLAPLAVGFLVGPKCLMGLLAGAIASGSMMAIMMSNSGGSWDNSKKLCEKIGVKKTEQGKACIVGDTVGDPFKDTSGPALNILIKLMSMVSLTVGPVLKDQKDWENWYFGIIPLFLLLAITAALMYTKILTWEDPLGKKLEEAKTDMPA